MNQEPPTLSHRCALRACPGATALADAAAQEWLGLLRSHPPHSRPFGLALSGGRTAAKLFPAVVEASRQLAVAWHEVEVFFADERWVPRDDSESNYRLARELLLDPLGVSPARVHPLYVGESPEYAAAQGQADMLRRVPVNFEGTPLLDLVVLGMGEDGHLASLFPVAPADVVASRAVYLPVRSPKPPPQRLTLTYAALIAARSVLVLVSGAAKAGVLRRSLAGQEDTTLARVLRGRRWTAVLTDC